MRRPWAFPLVFLSGAAAMGADDAPKAIAAWAAGPFEARVALDRAADPSRVEALVGTRIVFGEGVKVGDRYVPRKPGDPLLGGPAAESRGTLRIAAARLGDGGRTLILSTDPHARDVTYALSLPASLGGDLAYRLRGVEADWDNAKDDAKPEPIGWWPSLDSAEAATRLAGSAALDAMQARIKTPGRLTLKTLVALPKGKAAVRVEAWAPFEVALGNESAKSSRDPRGGQRAELTADMDGEAIDLTLTIALDGKSPFPLAVEANGRPIGPDRLTLPWVPPTPPGVPESPAPPSVLTGGDPSKGAILFKSEQAKCATCHKVRGVGGEVGPDLTDLIHRDRAWVYRALNEPSATIHPDYVPYVVLLKDGRALSGIIRAEGADAIKVIDTEAKATTVAKAEIEELKPSATSIMPVGLLGPIGEAGVRDLLAFLTGQ